MYNGYIYTCKAQNTDAEFTETNWEVKEPVYNRIYRCIKNTNSKTNNCRNNSCKDCKNCKSNEKSSEASYDARAKDSLDFE